MVTLEELYGKLDELITELKSTRGTGGGDGKTISMPNAEALKKAGDKALDGLGAVGTYGLAAGALFQAISGRKDAILSALDKLAKSKLSPPGLALAVEQARLASDPNAQAVKSGANTEMFKQRANETGTGVSYADQFKNANSAGTGLTSAGSLTGDKFDTLNQTLIKLNKDQLAKDRFANGLTDTDTLAKALILSQQRSTGNLNKPEDQDRAVVNAGKIADEIDKTAKVMRTSREDIANQTAERLKDGSVQAALSTLQTDQQRASFIKSQVGLTAFGKDVQDLAKDFTMFGGPTQKTMDTMVALGPAGRELGAAMKDLKSATNEQQRAAAEERLERAKGMINERQRDPRAARMAMAAEAFPEVKALQGFKRQFEQNRAAEGYNFQRNQGETSEGATKAINDQYKNLQQGRGQGGEPLSADAKMQGVILSGDRQAALGAATAMNRLNEEFNKSPEKIDAIIKKLKEFGPPAKQISGDTAVRPPYEVKKDLGTLGTTGQTFEPKDIVALLHKGERVLNPKENKDLSGLFDMISNIKSKSSENKEEKSPELPLPAATTESEVSVADNITLKDLHDSLQRLNSTMEIMAGHTADMKDTNRTTADMSQKMTGNRLAV
jgi:hypothetical protein